MPSQLVCRPEQDLPVAVLTVSGTLDRLTGDALGTAVRRSLAALPSKLLLDVTRLTVADPLALDVVTSAVCDTEEFPGVPVVVCGADAPTRRALAAAPGCARLEMAASCSRARADADAQPRSPGIRVRLRPVPEACRQVRALVAQACAKWHRADVSATVALVATELVANAVRHAHTTMEFTMALRDGRLTVAVRDGSRRMPRRLDPTVADPGGRGLRLVHDLTDAWGVLPTTDGKVVWTQLTTGAAA